MAARAAQPTAARWTVAPTVQVLCQDIRHVSDSDIAPESFDLVITDPPYDQQALPLYAALSAFCARTLRPGGALLVLCGQLYLPQIMAALSTQLTYKWILGWHMPGGQSVCVWASHAMNKWKPVLLFAKEPWRKPPH